MIPIGGWVAGGKRGTDLLRELWKFKSKACRNSFLPGTAVLLADGSSKPIEQVRPGDLVTTTDPRRDVTAPQAVVRTISDSGTKILVTLTIDADGATGDHTATITATDNHPFWLPTARRWTDAGNVRAGQALQTPSGTTVQVLAVGRRTQKTTVHNLGVTGTNSYYVLADRTPVLVHNQNSCIVIPRKMSAIEAAQAQELGDYAGGKAFIGQPTRNLEGIDGWMDGVPVSLKDTVSRSPAAVLRHLSKSEDQLKKANYRDAVVYIRADNIPVDKMRDFIANGPIASITTQGHVEDLYIRAGKQWIYCTKGTCA
jgi:hypothetical protein